MGAAEVIAFEEVRARKQWDALRGQLHTRFDQWLDGWEEQLRKPPPTLAPGDRDRVEPASGAYRRPD